MPYYAVRYKSCPDQIRIEKAPNPERAFRLAFGIPPIIIKDGISNTEYNNLGTSVSILRSHKRKIALLENPDNWIDFK